MLKFYEGEVAVHGWIKQTNGPQPEAKHGGRRSKLHVAVAIYTYE